MAGDDATQVSRVGSTDVTAATAVITAGSDSGIQFNNKMYKDWYSALSALQQLKSKNHASTTSSGTFRMLLLVKTIPPRYGSARVTRILVVRIQLIPGDHTGRHAQHQRRARSSLTVCPDHCFLALLSL
jgi:hypothetical protein